MATEQALFHERGLVHCKQVSQRLGDNVPHALLSDGRSPSPRSAVGVRKPPGSQRIAEGLASGFLSVPTVSEILATFSGHGSTRGTCGFKCSARARDPCLESSQLLASICKSTSPEVLRLSGMKLHCAVQLAVASRERSSGSHLTFRT